VASFHIPHGFLKTIGLLGYGIKKRANPHEKRQKKKPCPKLESRDMANNL